MHLKTVGAVCVGQVCLTQTSTFLLKLYRQSKEGGGGISKAANMIRKQGRYSPKINIQCGYGVRL